MKSLFDSHSVVLGTQMHMITAVFLVIEVLVFFNHWIYYLARPEEKTQKYYLILLILLIFYNLTGGLFPDPQYGLSILWQNIVAYAAGFAMCMYAPYYFYKAFELEQMRFHAHYGIFIFLLGPFLLFFVVVYSVTGNLEVARKWGVVIPFFYALSIIYSMTQSLISQRKTRRKGEIIALYLAIIPWISLTIITYVNASQAIEVTIVNSGMVMVTFLYIRKHIHNIRQSDKDLLLSRQLLLEVNKDMEKANIELAKNNNELENKERQRTKDISELHEKRMNTFFNVAHEMKTPLTLLKDYMHRLLVIYPDAEPVQFAKKHIDKLSRDVINLFDLLNSENGIHQYDHQANSNLSTIVTERILLFETAAQRRSIVLDHHIEPNLYVRANATALERVVNNLMDNALKYSPSGSVIKIILQVLTEQQIVFSISDQGPGIEKDLQQVIFEPYARISYTYTSGMGMGLPIVKTILDQIAATIELQSDPISKPGCEFTVILPYQKEFSTYYSLVSRGHEHILSPQEPDLHTVLADEYAPVRYPVDFQSKEFVHSDLKKTILIVEDNVEMLQFLLHYLSPIYNSYYAFDGQQALEKLTSMPEPDLIVCDVMMEKMDGFQFRQHLLDKQNYYLSIPFIFLSARSEQKMKGIHLQAADFIEKPFDIQELITKIQTLIGLGERKKEQMIRNIIHFTQSMSAAGNYAMPHYTTPPSISSQLLEGKVEEEMVTNIEQFARKLDHFIHTETIEITSRERELILLFPSGLANKQIASKLKIREATVAKHIQNIFRKLNVNSKMELINKVASITH